MFFSTCSLKMYPPAGDDFSGTLKHWYCDSLDSPYISTGGGALLMSASGVGMQQSELYWRYVYNIKSDFDIRLKVNALPNDDPSTYSCGCSIYLNGNDHGISRFYDGSSKEQVVSRIGYYVVVTNIVYYIRLARSSGTLTRYYSTDGSSWTTFGTASYSDPITDMRIQGVQYDPAGGDVSADDFSIT